MWLIVLELNNGGYNFKMKIKELRIKNNMSQVDLSRKLKYSRTLVSKWEKGEREPNVATLIEIAKLFNVSVDYLVGNNYETKETGQEKIINEVLTEEQQILLDKIKTLDNIQFQQVETFVDKVIALDEEQDKMVKILISEKYKNIDNN